MLPESETEERARGGVIIDSVRAPAGGSRALIGRRRELRALTAGLTAALAGRGRLFLLLGEPGIGKTRLAEELVGEAAGAGARVVWGSCWEAGGAPAYWPWVQILRRLVRDSGTDALEGMSGNAAAHLSALLPEIRGRSPEPEGDSEHARFYLFDAVATLLQAASRRQPLVLVFDDLHAADLPTLLLLEFVARGGRDDRILVLGTARETEARLHPAVARILEELARAGERVPLSGLTETEVGELMEELSGSVPSSSTVAAVFRRTEGNPLFVEEVARLLTGEGGASGELSIPPRVRDAIERRLQSLSGEAIEILRVASVMGKEVDPRDLGVATGAARETIAELVRRAGSLGILRAPAEEGAAPVVFAHALFRETLVTSLSLEERRRIHGRIADALGPSAPAAALAFHLLHAGRPAEAAAHAERAASSAMDFLAYEDAAGHYDLALRALGESGAVDEPRRGKLLIGRGEARRRSGDVGGARDSFTEAAAVARAIGGSRLLAEAALGFAGPWVAMGRVDASVVGLLEEAERALEAADSVLRAKVLARLAMELYFEPGSLERRIALADEALEAARSSADPRTLADVLGARHFALWGPGNVEERLATATELLEMARELGSEELAAQGHHWRTVDLLELGEIRAADAEIEALSGIAGRLRLSLYLWQAALHRSVRALLEGRYDDARALAEQALDHGRKAQPESAEGTFLTFDFVRRRDQGLLGEVTKEMEALVRAHPRYLAVRVLAGVLRLETGDRPGAEAELAGLFADEGRDFGRDYAWLGLVGLLSELCVALGDRRRARPLYELLRPYARRNLIVGRSAAYLGSGSYFLGRLAVVLEEWSDAERHLEDGFRQNVAMGARPAAARTLLEHARLLARRSGEGDRRRGRELAERALEEARALGMPRVVEEALALAESPELSGAAGPSAAPAGATAKSFLREGRFWTIHYEGRVLHLPDSKGLRCLAHLIRQAGRDVPAVELWSATAGAAPDAESPPGAAELAEAGLEGHGLADEDEILDARARREVRTRLAELEAELAEAERSRDAGRIAVARREVETLRDALSAALGIGGRPRRTRSAGERARVNLTKVIRKAIRHIGEESPELGRHLERAVRTGRLFSYVPGQESGWML